MLGKAPPQGAGKEQRQRNAKIAMIDHLTMSMSYRWLLYPNLR
jgi:hypothetical protein